MTPLAGHESVSLEGFQGDYGARELNAWLNAEQAGRIEYMDRGVIRVKHPVASRKEAQMNFSHKMKFPIVADRRTLALDTFVPYNSDHYRSYSEKILERALGVTLDFNGATVRVNNQSGLAGELALSNAGKLNFAEQEVVGALMLVPENWSREIQKDGLVLLVWPSYPTAMPLLNEIVVSEGGVLHIEEKKEIYMSGDSWQKTSPVIVERN